VSAIDDLVSFLETAGFRVAPPGDNTAALPAVVLSPVSLRIEPGIRQMYHEIDLLPSVAASPWEEQHNEAVEYARQVCLALTSNNDHQFQLGTPFPYETDTERQPPSQFYRINLRFVGPDLCDGTPPPAPQYAVWDAGWDRGLWNEPELTTA